MPVNKWCLAALAVCSVTWFLTSEANAGDILVIGSISDDAQEETATFQPLAEYLTPRLGNAGLSRVEVHVAQSAGGMANALRSGQVDIYIDSPLIAELVGRASGARPLLRRWKRGVAEYQTVFIAHRDANVDDLNDLVGQVVAFDEHFSSSGYLLPKAILLRRGFQLVRLERPEDPVPAGAIGYVFSGGDVNTVFWTLKQRVIAGVTNRWLLEQFGRKRDELVVFAESEKLPRQVVMIRGDLDPVLVATIEATLLGMEHEELGRRALAEFEETVRFDRFPNGVEAAFAPVRAALDVLGEDTAAMLPPAERPRDGSAGS